MSSCEGRIHLQGSRATWIEQLSKDSKKDHFKGLDVAVLQSYLDQLEFYWSKFEEQHEKLVGAKDCVIMDHAYITEKVYDTCLGCYTSAKASLIALIRRKDDSGDILSTSFRRANTSIVQQVLPMKQLAEVPLPHFDGTSSEWRTYKDTFTHVVINNAAYTAIDKIIHLKGTLTGEPFKLITNIKVSEQAFTSAWAMLCERYENSRILVTAHLENLLNPPTVRNRTSKELNALLSTVTEARDALLALESPVEHWDQILVFVVSQKLDDTTREAWENKIGASTVYPKYEDLKKFITSRARAMESIERHQGGQSNSKNNQKNSSEASKGNNNHHQSQAKAFSSSKSLVGNTTGTAHPEKTTSWAEMSRFPCSMCTDDHFVVTCPQFRKLNPVARKEIVARKRICYNCFGRHAVQECKSKKRCLTCDRKHHTMIHIEGEDPPAPLTPDQKKAAAVAKSLAAAQNSTQSHRPATSAQGHQSNVS